MQHAALCLSGTADVSVQLTPYAAYRDSGAKPWAWSSYEGLKLGSYGEYIAYVLYLKIGTYSTVCAWS